MLIEWSEHDIEGIGEVLFATDAQRPDDYSNFIASSFRVTPALRYVLQVCNGDGTFIDVGANLGVFTLPVARAGNRTLAIEMLPRPFALLAAAVVANGLRNVVPVHAAASRQVGTLHTVDNSAWSQVSQRADGFEVPSLTVDAAARIFGFEQADVVKVDVEGSEKSVFEGMARFLRKNPRADIIFEANVHTCAVFGYPVKDLFSFFDDLGYRLFLIHEHEERLIPRTPDQMQVRVCEDYLVSRKRPNEMGNFQVLPLTPDEVIDTLAREASSSELFHVAYAALALEAAPASIRKDARLRAVRERLDQRSEELKEARAHLLQATG